MAKKEIESINVTKAKNGGYVIRHSYRRTPTKKRDAPSGIGYDYPEPEEFVFGPDDGPKVLKHITTAIEISDKGKEDEEGD